LEISALKLVDQRVHAYYWQYDWNCASTTLRILADDFGVDLHEQACYAFAQQFENKFGSLLCRELRPQGFYPDNPPHLCKGLTRKAIEFGIVYVTDLVEETIGLT
jgi:hypothetical protein